MSSADETCASVCGIGRLDAAAMVLCQPRGEDLRLIGAHGFAAGEVTDTVFGRVGRDVTAEALRRSALVERDDGTFAVPGHAGALRVVIVGRRDSDSWSHDACLAQILEGTARIAGLAVADHLTLARREHATADRVRNELLRAVHEDVVQRLFGVTLALDGDGTLDAELRRISAAQVEMALYELRDILRRSTIDEPQPAGDRMAGYLAELEREGVNVDVEVGSGAEAELTVGRSVLAEAIRNARKHASPTRIDVVLRETVGELQLWVSNDGVGARGDRRAARGVGLELAAAEVEQRGGTLSHGPVGSDRWVLRLALPIEETHEYIDQPHPFGTGR